jgi:hypothetical protein
MPDDFWDDTYLVEKDGALIRKRHPEDYRCDFCCQKLGESCWTYPCGFVPLPLTDDPTGLPVCSDDPWSCCQECKPFLDAKDWRGLAHRSATIQLAMMGHELDVTHPNYEQAIQSFITHFQRFDAARTGEPYEEHAPYTEHH